MIQGVVRMLPKAGTKAFTQAIRKELFSAAQEGTLEVVTKKLTTKYPDLKGFIKGLYKFNENGLNLAAMNDAAKAFRANHEAERAYLAAQKAGKVFSARG